jgi:hypothetical protein
MVIKTYRARTQREAAWALSADATVFAAHDYVVAAQSWAGAPAAGAASFFILIGVVFAVAGLLAIGLWILAVLFLVIGIVADRGKGELTVTWAKR